MTIPEMPDQEEPSLDPYSPEFKQVEAIEQELELTRELKEKAKGDPNFEPLVLWRPLDFV